ncbi:hypothetical protein ACH5RR_014290 [Cinchona calisaya]|uniref:ATP synthase protein MI25 n=1 Tax=Cinchona calisaya TaxID=153742 RepID=A0ABD3A8A0_9GENT
MNPNTTSFLIGIMGAAITLSAYSQTFISPTQCITVGLFVLVFGLLVKEAILITAYVKPFNRLDSSVQFAKRWLKVKMSYCVTQKAPMEPKENNDVATPADSASLSQDKNGKWLAGYTGSGKQKSLNWFRQEAGFRIQASVISAVLLGRERKQREKKIISSSNGS